MSREQPTLDEAAAVLHAVDAYAQALGKTAMVRELQSLLEQLRDSIGRVLAVTITDDP